MPGDYTRWRFDPRHHFTAVLLQQGRVELDSDWNEEPAIEEHLKRMASIRQVREVQREELNEEFVARYFDAEVVVTDESDASSAATWQGHDGALIWLGENVAPVSHGETVAVETLGHGDEPGSGTIVTIRPRPARYELREGRIVRIRLFTDANAVLRSAGLSGFEALTNEEGAKLIQFGDAPRGRNTRRGRAIISASYRFGSGETGGVQARPTTVVVGPCRADGTHERSRRWVPSRVACWLLAVSAGLVFAGCAARRLLATQGTRGGGRGMSPRPRKRFPWIPLYLQNLG